jgi:hypothetical protein
LDGPYEWPRGYVFWLWSCSSYCLFWKLTNHQHIISLASGPFESSLSDVSGDLVADGVADDLGVEIAGNAMGDFCAYEHRDLSSW